MRWRYEMVGGTKVRGEVDIGDGWGDGGTKSAK